MSDFNTRWNSKYGPWDTGRKTAEYWYNLGAIDETERMKTKVSEILGNTHPWFNEAVEKIK